ncbi:Rad4-domain-containing protein [Phanerochaete sordida]|uniref:Rad4-domain-containing protein n=1 Tax=Phanerochaete sordida TaxID=48140 RepID=A0A9P3G5D0_9APHY|nr:Rad4-domain-containing protein [Phanerochaete sordida]
MQPESSSVVGDESEDDFDWEEVEVPLQQEDLYVVPSAAASGSSTPAPNIEITIQTRAKPKQDDTAKKRAAELYAARVARLTCHKAHTLLLLANARTRNKWINDQLLHARLMSLTPINLQNAFALINKSRYPDAAVRGHMFQSAVERLVLWWIDFFSVLPTGHIRSRSFEDVQEELRRKEARKADRKGKGRARDVDEDDEDEDRGELIRSEKSLMKHALMRKGSRDTSAQLFTALCRAIGIPARLVVSLQSVPWQAKVGKPKTSPKKKRDAKGKGKEKATEDDEDEDEDMEQVDIPTSNKNFPGNGQRVDGGSTPSTPDKGKQKAPPVINLRKSKGRKLGSAPQKKRDRTPDPTTSAPVFWTEVFSRADAKWLPVDPIRGYVNKRVAFDPTANANLQPGTRVENRMVYVVAFEEDGYARDVTPRYAREFGAKVAKMQHGGKGKKEWWESVMRIVTRPFRLNRDDLEDDELQANQLTEKMPDTMAGFKGHPLYVLARHLRRDEVVHPPAELGRFRGEAVYPRANVRALKTAETWMRQGRVVRAGAQPMKWVKQHAVTVNRRRAVEMALAERDGLPVAGQGAGAEGGGDVMQGLYAEAQTELYVPQPVVDGKVPKNDFGNIDLYVPTMLPAGAAYVPHKGAAKVARQLGFDFAEAVTGFEFKKRRAFPVITGVVVAAEHEQALLEAYWEAEQEAEKKRRKKEHELVIKRWQKLIQGLRVRQRVQEQYAGPSEPQKIASEPAPEDEAHENQDAGGFLTTADDVVRPYTLPRNLHVVLPERSDAPEKPEAQVEPSGSVHAEDAPKAPPPPSPFVLEPLEVEEDDEPLEEVQIPEARTPAEGPIRSMAELAAAHAQTQAEADAVEETLPEPAVQAATPKASARPSRSGTGTPAKANGKATNGRTPRKQPARRGRKRARSDDDSALSGTEPAPAAPAKRARVAPAPAVTSDRVLRSRRGKSEAEKQAEREAEEAIRAAVGE